MVTATNDRKRRYNAGEIKDIARHENITGRDDMSFLCALHVHPHVVNSPQTGGLGLAFLRTISIPVIETSDYMTGYYIDHGATPVLVINDESSVLDYDFISELHPAHDCDVYLWTSHPWEVEGSPLGIYGEWFRREVYKDGLTPFDGKTLGWEDLPPVSNEEEDNEWLS